MTLYCFGIKARERVTTGVIVASPSSCVHRGYAMAEYMYMIFIPMM